MSARLKNAVYDSDGFWRDHSTGQKVTFVGYILYDKEFFKKGEFKLKALTEYSKVKLLGDAMPEAVIEQIPVETLNAYTNEKPVKVKEFRDNLGYVGQAVSITVTCMKEKGVKEPIFVFDTIENFNLPKEK